MISKLSSRTFAWCTIKSQYEASCSHTALRTALATKYLNVNEVLSMGRGMKKTDGVLLTTVVKNTGVCLMVGMLCKSYRGLDKVSTNPF